MVSIIVLLLMFRRFYIFFVKERFIITLHCDIVATMEITQKYNNIDLQQIYCIFTKHANNKN